MVKTEKSILILSIIILVLTLISCKSDYIDISELINNKENFVDKTVTIKGKTSLSDLVRCTLQFCSEENPCCNSCSGNLVLKSENIQIELTGKEIKCTGTNCDITCSPLQKNKEYIITGKFSEQNSKYSLEITDYKLSK